MMKMMLTNPSMIHDNFILSSKKYLNDFKIILSLTNLQWNEIHVKCEKCPSSYLFQMYSTESLIVINTKRIEKVTSLGGRAVQRVGELAFSYLGQRWLCKLLHFLDLSFLSGTRTRCLDSPFQLQINSPRTDDTTYTDYRQSLRSASKKMFSATTCA